MVAHGKRCGSATVGLQPWGALVCVALAWPACTSDAEDPSWWNDSQKDGGTAGVAGSGAAAGSGGSTGTDPVPEQFPLMIYGDTTMLNSSPSLSDVGANLFFAYYAAYNPTAYAFAALEEAPAGKGQIVYRIDPDVVKSYTDETKTAKLDAFLASVADHPSVYGFYLYDVPNIGWSVTREMLKTIHDHCKAAAPDKPTFTILVSELEWGSAANPHGWPPVLLGVADIEAFSYTAYGGCDGNGYCHTYGEYEKLLKGFSAAHEGLEENNTKAYWPFVTAYHTDPCDETCGFSPPTKEIMEKLIDGAIAIDPKFDNGIIYFNQGGAGDYIGIQQEPSIAAAVTAINKERVSRPSVFPMHPAVEPPADPGSDPACAGTQPAAMVELPGGYSIDRTEVTRCQYQAWLDTHPSLADQGKACTWNTTYVPRCGWPPGEAGDHPVVCVDWCDAYAYCKGVGKRLCGKIGGGPDEYDDDASESQWVKACTSGGVNTYAYGSSYDEAKCNGYHRGIKSTAAAASQAGCQSSVSGYAGVYDLSGNVWEWEDSCNNSTGAGNYCRLRGGAFLGWDPGLLACQYTGPGDLVFPRGYSYSHAGFRCCSE